MKIEQDWVPIFIEFLKFLRINSKDVVSDDPRGAKLELWRSQKMALDFIIEGLEQDAHMFMIGKSRQLGMSTFFECLDLFWLMYYPNMVGVYVTDNKSNVAIIRSKISFYVNSFPQGFFGSKISVKSNENYMEFSNGSRLDFLIAGKNKVNWGESRGYIFAHVTECSKYGKPEGIANFIESFSDVHPNRLYIFESTSNGVNHWKEMWDEFGRDKFSKRRLFIGWWGKDSNIIKRNDPRYRKYGYAEPDELETELIEKVKKDYGYKVTREQLAWYRSKWDNQSVTEADLHQNQPWTIEQSFVLQGYSYFPTHQLDIDLKKAVDSVYYGYKYIIGNDFWGVLIEPIVDANRVHEVNLRVWEEPEEGAVYAIGCDPAYGRSDDKDSHAIVVYRCFADKLVQVAEWTDNTPGTREAAWVLAHLAGVYRNCLINVEAAPGPGGVIINELENLRDRVRVDPRFDEVADPKQQVTLDDFLHNARWYLYRKLDGMSPGSVKGWESNFKTKGQMMALMHDRYTMGMLELKSVSLVEEMRQVIRNGDKIEAPRPLHDDRVIATALAIRAWRDELEMGLVYNSVLYSDYIAEKNGETVVSDEAKYMNSIIRSFFQAVHLDAENPHITPREAWLDEKGFIER